VLGILGILLFVSVVRSCGQAMQVAGILRPNQVPAAALERLEAKKLLTPSEKLVLYYDETFTGDGSELALITTERLVYFKEGHTTAFPLSTITDVQKKDDSKVNQIIEVQGEGGQVMKIDITPSDAAEFMSTLEKARKPKGAQ
jgi:hypothetical protein